MKKKYLDTALQALASILIVAVVITAVLRFRDKSSSGVKLIEAKSSAAKLVTKVTTPGTTAKTAEMSQTKEMTDAPEISSEKPQTSTAMPQPTSAPVTTTTSYPTQVAVTTVAAPVLPAAVQTAPPTLVDVYEEFSETIAIPFDTEYRETPDLPLGTQEVFQYGVDGTMLILYQNHLQNGVLLEQRELSRTVTQEPLTYIILVGTAGAERPDLYNEESAPEQVQEAAIAEQAAYVPGMEAVATIAEVPEEAMPPVLPAAAEIPEIPEVPTVPEVVTVTEQVTEQVTEAEVTEAPVTEAPSQVDAVSGGVDNLGFATPGSIEATEHNLSIIKSLMSINGYSHYLNFSDNGDGTITVDGVTLAVSAKHNWKTTSYDGYECAKLSNFAYGDCNPTATGILAQRGIVASSGEFPFGTIVFVEDYGLAVVGDIHGMGDSFLDLSMDPHEIENGIYVPTGHRNIYVIALP